MSDVRGVGAVPDAPTPQALTGEFPMEGIDPAPASEVGYTKGESLRHGGGIAVDSQGRPLYTEKTVRSLYAQVSVQSALLREVLEAWAVERGVSLESTVEPGSPARNYQLMDDLGIGHLARLSDRSESDGSGVGE